MIYWYVSDGESKPQGGANDLLRFMERPKQWKIG